MPTFRTFCLTLPESPHRKEAARVHFEERGLRVEFFDGIHAEKFGLRTVHPYEIDHPGTDYKMGPSSVGNCLSQIMLWGALSVLWDDHFLVLEDDARFQPDWHKRMIGAMNDVPQDFDMLYIGSCCTQTKNPLRVKGDVFTVHWPMCTHAYIVARKAIPVLLATQRKIYAPIDISLSLHSLPLLKVYTVLPRIVDQAGTTLEP